MAEKKSFIRQFWKEKKMIGAMAPSSRFLAAKMVKVIDFKTANVIIELGPGTGVFTKELLKNMRPDAKLFAFELNDAFYDVLKNSFDDNRLFLIHDSAEKMQDYLNEQGVKEADVVVSALPLSVFSDSLRDAVLDASSSCLKENGQYVQFQYSLYSKKHIKKRFSKMSIDFTALNLPPAFIYSCKKVQ
jgi:phospholipid N-methyltransferase